MLTRLTCRVVLTLASLLPFLFTASATTSADDLDNIVFEGVIRDTAGAVIPAAKVVVIQTATGVERITASNTEGRFRIAVGAPGSYKLKASANGFNEQE